MKKGVSPFRWRVQDEVEHRRDTVRELQSSGFTIPMIAQKLGYSVITIKKDSAALHKQAQEHFLNHLEQRLPYEVDSTLGLYKSVIRQAKELAESTQSEGVKVRALTLMKDARRDYQDLLLRGEYVKRGMDASIEVKRRLLDKLQQQQQSSSSSSQSDQQDTDDNDNEEVEEEIQQSEEAMMIMDDNYDIEQPPESTTTTDGKGVSLR